MKRANRVLALILALLMTVPTFALAEEDNGLALAMADVAAEIVDTAVEEEGELSLEGLEKQGPEAPPEEEAPVEEEAPMPVLTVFAVQPEGAAVIVRNAQGETVEPEESGDYQLLPGDYVYDAQAEGYVGVFDVPFTVAEGQEYALVEAVLEEEGNREQGTGNRNSLETAEDATEPEGNADQKPSPATEGSGSGEGAERSEADEVVPQEEAIAEDEAQEETTSPITADAVTPSPEGEGSDPAEEPTADQKPSPATEGSGSGEGAERSEADEVVPQETTIAENEADEVVPQEEAITEDEADEVVPQQEAIAEDEAQEETTSPITADAVTPSPEGEGSDPAEEPTADQKPSPLGDSSARESVQWTDSSENGSADPWTGGSAEALTDEVVPQQETIAEDEAQEETTSSVTADAANPGADQPDPAEGEDSEAAEALNTADPAEALVVEQIDAPAEEAELSIEEASEEIVAIPEVETTDVLPETIEKTPRMAGDGTTTFLNITPTIYPEGKGTVKCTEESGTATLTVTPAEHYRLKELIVKVDGTTAETTDQGSNTYTFAYSEGAAVAVSAVFELIGSYNLWVDGVEVAEYNASDILGNGTARYNATTKTLTLNGANITKPYILRSTSYAGIYAQGDLNIVVESSSSVNTPEMQFGIYATGSLTIQGSGKLDVHGQCAINSGNGINIKNASVTATSGRLNYAITTGSADITIENANVTATCTDRYAIHTQGQLTIKDSTVNATGGAFGMYSMGTTTIEGVKSVVTAKSTIEGGGNLISQTGISIGEGLAIAEPEKAKFGKSFYQNPDMNTILDADGKEPQKATIKAPTRYTVTVKDSLLFDVAADKEKAVAGDTVTLTVKEPEELPFVLKALTVTYTEDGKTKTLTPTKGGDGKYTFEMPDADVTVRAESARLQLVVVAKSDGGKVTTDKERAIVDETVTLTLAVDTGYNLETLNVTYVDDENKTVAVTKVDDTHYTFVMPDASVDVKAEFLTPWMKLQKQIDEAANGDTITLTQDLKALSSDTALNVPAGKKITLNLAGYILDRGLAQGVDKAVQGGSVITVQGELTVTGKGIIQGGNAVRGGGVYVDRSGKFTLASGLITDNTSSGFGGGVHVRSQGVFAMTGGSIARNTAGQYGGVYCAAGSTFELSGDPVVQDNIPTNVLDAKVSNVGFGDEENGRITVTGKLGEKASIGVDRLPGVFTTGLKGNGTAKNFTSDYAAYKVFLTADGEAELNTPWGWLQDRINNAKDGEIIQLPRDINAQPDEKALVVPEGKNVTIDLDKFRINRRLDQATEDGNVITVNGSLTVVDTSPTQAGLITGGNNQGNGGGVIVGKTGSFTLAGGLVRDNTAAANAGGVLNNGTFIMAGGEVSDNNATGNGGGVSNNGTFTLSGGKVGGNGATVYGGGVFNGGTFKMTGGEVSGNTVTGNNALGGGVYNVSAFEMTGGEISGNAASNHGGGVLNNGTFNMSGGTISKNEAALRGGGAYNLGTFNMSGSAAIEGNTSGYEGGGVALSSKKAVFNMTGSAAIKDNTSNEQGGGVHVELGGTFKLSGGVEISGNKGKDGVDDNVCLKYDSPTLKTIITVDGKLTNAKPIGVGVQKASENTPDSIAVTVGLKGKGTDANFVSELEGYEVFLNADGEAILSTPWTWLQGRINDAKDGETIRLPVDADAQPYEKALVVPEGKNVTIDLNGFRINRQLKEAAEGGNVFTVNGSLTVKDSGKGGVITGGNNRGNGGGVVVGKAGSFTLEGGLIQGNKAVDGHGGGVFNNGTFTMSDGTISKNAADLRGGGVYNLGTFNMSGSAAIEGNTSGYEGGGVALSSTEAVFNMTGSAAIKDNTSNEQGGGVHVELHNALGLSGGVEISGNKGKGNVDDNVCLKYDSPTRKAIIKVEGKLTNAKPIGVGVQKGPQNKPDSIEITAGLKGKDNEAVKGLVSELEGYQVFLNADSGEAVLAVPVKVALDKNSDDATGSMSGFSMPKNVAGRLEANQYVWRGHSFAGWNTKANGSGAQYADKDIVTVNEKTTLYAQWTACDFTVDAIVDQTYAGKALTPAPVVKDGDKTLKAGTDYTVAYKNNVNAGTATVTVTGKGNYADAKAVTQKFAINKAAIRITANDTTGPDNPDVGKLGYTVSENLAESDRKALDIKLKLGKASGSDPKTYPIEVTYKENANYTVRTVNGTYTVWEGVQLVIEGYIGEYDGKAHGISVQDAKGKALKNVRYADSKLSAKEFGEKGKSSLTYTDAGSYKVYYCVTENGESLIGSQQVVITKKPVTVTTGSASKAYDGKALKQSGASVKGLVKGESVTAKATGSITEVGKAENTVSITWDKAKKGNYEVTESLGTLTVTKNDTQITLTAASAEKTYDGKALSDDGVSVKGLPSGFTVQAKAKGSRKSAGTARNTVSEYAILNGSGKDVTKSFSNVNTVDGTLTVRRAAITIAATDIASKDAPQAKNLSYVITGPLVKADEAGLKIQLSLGEPTEAASRKVYPILVSYTDNPNYDITVLNGKYTLSEKLAFTANSYGGVYDGVPHSIDVETAGDIDAEVVFSWEPLTSEQAARDYAKAHAGENYDRTDVGTSTVYYAVIYDGELYTGSKDIVMTPKALTVTTGSASKTYDGKALTKKTASLKGLESGETATVTATGKQTKVGSSANTYKIKWGTAKAGNYEIVEKLGTLTVKAAKQPEPTVTPKPTVKPEPTTKPTTKPTAKPTAKPAAEPDQTMLARVRPSGSTALKVTWSKVKGAQGYDVFFTKCGTYDYQRVATVKAGSARSATVKGLKKGVAYKAYVKAWKRVKGKKTYIGKASPIVHAITGSYGKLYANVSKVIVKAAGVTLKVGRTRAIKAEVKLVRADRKRLRHAPELRYYTTDRNVATVNGKGVITAKGKGSCVIYAVAVNGALAKVKVNVK